MRTPAVLAVAFLFLAACSSSVPPAVFATRLAQISCAPQPPVSVAGPAGASLRIVALGDAGEGPDERGSFLPQTIDAIKRLDSIDAVLLLGDNVYRCGLRNASDPNWQRVIAPLFAIGKPVYPVLGNHDWGKKAIIGCTFSAPAAEVEKTGSAGFELWRFPAPAYVITTDVAEFIMFDSSPIAYGWPDKMSESLCALRGALAQPKSKPWRIAVGHHPLYSCGDHGGENATKNIRLALQQLFADSGVDLYVSGHDHDLEFPAAPGPPAYLVSGSASKIRERGALCRQSDSFKIVPGFAVLTITAGELNVRVYCNGISEPCMERDISAR